MAEKKETPKQNEYTEEERDAFDAFIYHQRRAGEEALKAVEALLPEGFRVHGAEAGKEFIKGLKVLVDAGIEELERASKKAQEAAGEATSSTGKTKVKVQVE